MTILAADDIAHPPLEALFTVDEETGMTGAQRLQPGWLQGQILLNLDTEEDDELTIGCAGGCEVTATLEFAPEAVPEDRTAFQLTVRGLQGGHSGVDIHRGRGNSNKLMNRLLWLAEEATSMQIAQVDGGGLRNAIPRESKATIVVPNDGITALRRCITTATGEIRSEYATTDTGLEICLESVALPPQVAPQHVQAALLRAVYACPSGIYRMSPDVEDLVQTSNNLARVVLADGKFQALCLTRSSVDSERDDLARAIRAVFELVAAEVDISGAYPGWQPAPSSPIVTLMSETYQELFGKAPMVAACHAGLECGIVGQHYPEMDMISFGPTIRGAHSPDERVQIRSVQKYWEFLLETLRRIPLAA